MGDMKACMLDEPKCVRRKKLVEHGQGRSVTLVEAGLQQGSVLVMENPGSQGDRGKRDLKARMGEYGYVLSMSPGKRTKRVLDELKCFSRVVHPLIVASLTAALGEQGALLAEQNAACEEQERTMEELRAGLKPCKLLLETARPELDDLNVRFEQGRIEAAERRAALERAVYQLKEELDEDSGWH